MNPPPTHVRPGSNASLAYALLRFTLGINMLLHGLVRLVPGPSGFADTLVQGFANTPLPAPLVYAFAWVLPFAEAAVGALLIVGLWTRLVLMVGGLLMAALVFGTALRSQWETLGLQMFYSALYAALLATEHVNALSIDGWRRRTAGAASPPPA